MQDLQKQMTSMRAQLAAAEASALASKLVFEQLSAQREAEATTSNTPKPESIITPEPSHSDPTDVPREEVNTVKGHGEEVNSAGGSEETAPLKQTTKSTSDEAHSDPDANVRGEEVNPVPPHDEVVNPASAGSAC